MDKLVKTLYGIIAFSCSSLTLAGEEKPWYIGALYTQQEISDKRSEFTVLGAVLGYRFNESFSIEGRYGQGTEGYSKVYEDMPEYSGSDYREDIEYQSSLLFRGAMPLGSVSSVYAFAGVSRTKVEIQAWGENRDQSGNVYGRFYGGTKERAGGLTYGAGLSAHIGSRMSVFVEYQVFPDIDLSLPYTDLNSTYGYVYPEGREPGEKEEGLKGINVGVTYAFY